MKRLVDLLKYILSYKCSECRGALYYEGYDGILDKNIYKCSKGGELRLLREKE